MRGVDADIDEDVESFDLCDVYWDETAVRVVDKEIATQGARGIVVDAAGAVCDVSHDEGFCSWAELGDDIGDGGCEN